MTGAMCCHRPLAATLFLTLACSVPSAHAQNLRRDFWVPNGRVTALAVRNDILYLGGSFSYVGPPTGGGAPLDALTGSPTSFPHVAGRVNAAVPDGNGGWYIGGEFSQAGGAPRTNLAHVLPDGSVDSWSPTTNYRVYDLALSGSTVYLAGDFSQVNGQSRPQLAAVDATSGALLSWNSGLGTGSSVSGLAATESVLYVCGSFTSIGGQPRNRLAALDLTTGNATPWNPNANGSVSTVVVSDSLVYVGGSFTGIGPRARNNLAAIDQVTGAATNWNPNPNSSVHSISVDGETVYIAGGFTTVGGTARNRLAAVETSTGLLKSWNANITSNTVSNVAAGESYVYINGTFGALAGQNRRGLAALDKITAAPVAWNPDPESLQGTVPIMGALVVDGSSVFVGGDFSSIGGIRRAMMAAIDVNTGRATAWNSGQSFSLSFTVNALATNASSVFDGDSYGVVARDLGSGAIQWDVDGLGGVFAIAFDGPRVYVGGGFTQLESSAINRLAALDAASGTVGVVPSPPVSNTVVAVHIDGDRGYLAGTFEYIGGEFRSHIGSFNAATGFVDGWNPEAVGAVNALAVSGSSVYAGGSFTAIGGDYRNSLAALDPLTGFVQPWNPNPNDQVTALTVGGGALYVGGEFTTMDGQARRSLAAFDLVSGALTDWNPNAGGTPLDVTEIAIAGNTVFVGGGFEGIAGYAHPYLAVFESPVADVPVSSESHLELAAGPNPSRGSVRVQFSLPSAERVSLSVFDLQGREVALLAGGELPAGPHQFVWNAGQGSARVENGVYFLRLSASGRHASKRIVLVR